ncbi:uncharacterized protein LOC122148581 [Cyprinus carpio]|uniref:Uncharacterized protein LOC122148581 n=1 Tax=Cyprinus carpio TaxID=7962 RepID=A0A9Q9Z304_CYPCA|nr:uncharacterized protein LOC122148581 [Cyprinus carpio]
MELQICPSSVILFWQEIPPNLPLPPPLIDLYHSSTLILLDLVSPSAHPQPTICGVGLPRVCPSPAPLVLSLEDPLTPPPRPRLCLSTVTQWLHHGLQRPRLHRSPSVHQLHRAPSCLQLCLGQSSPYLHLGTTLLAVPRPSSSTSVLCHSGSAVALWILGFTLALRLSAIILASTSTCLTAVGRLHVAIIPSSTMAPPSVGSTGGGHHGCGLGPVWLLLLQLSPVAFLAPLTICSALLSSVSRMAPPSIFATLVVSLPSCLPFHQPFVASPSSSHTPSHPPWIVLLQWEDSPSGMREYC